MQNYNIAEKFFSSCDFNGLKDAVYFSGCANFGEPKQMKLSFAELKTICSEYAFILRKNGIKKNDKVLIMLRYSPEFIVSVFAVFSIGAAPVLIDPGMGFSRLMHCIEKTQPDAIIAVPIVHWISKLFPKPFRTVRSRFSLKGFLPPLSKIFTLPPPLEILSKPDDEDIKIDFAEADNLAAIVFTTGSTGPAKGVEYSHGNFNAQIDIIKKYYNAGPDFIDMPCFPLFAMFSLCLGMPCVIPDINPSRPSKAPPAKIADCIEKNKVSFSFASPTLWKNLSSYCIEKNIKLSSLKKILMAGAPISAKLHQSLLKISPEVQIIVPYGATEALPVANFTASEMLSETAALTAEGAGYCVGYPVDECSVKVIKITEQPIQHIDDAEELKNGEIGELIVQGPFVTKKYHNHAEANKFAKIADPDGSFWHRMGDAVYLDNKNRLWFCGRIAHRVITKDITLYSCIEEPFNLASNCRCALIGIGNQDDQTPVIVVETNLSLAEFRKLAQELSSIKIKSCNNLRISHFARMNHFPVDIRHNAKISREKIREIISKDISKIIIIAD